MKRQIVFALAFLAVAFTFHTSGVTCSYAVDGYTATYSVMGKTSRDFAQISVNTGATIVVETFSNSTNISVVYNVNFFTTEMPYELNKTIFLLDTESIASSNYNGTALTCNTEMNPFYETYGLKYFYAELNNSIVNYKCKWEYYSGVLIHMEIDVKSTMYEHITYRYLSTSFDIYAQYADTYMTTVNVIKALASPAGFMIIISIIFVAVVAISLYLRTRKNTKIPDREARSTQPITQNTGTRSTQP